jgi:RimJ/RimL family protein N-acetyltransferase
VPRFAHLWLYAEIDNHRAIALYERLGMRIVHSDAMQHAMVWEFQDFKMPDPKDTGGRK